MGALTIAVRSRPRIGEFERTGTITMTSPATSPTLLCELRILRRHLMPVSAMRFRPWSATHTKVPRKSPVPYRILNVVSRRPIRQVVDCIVRRVAVQVPHHGTGGFAKERHGQQTMKKLARPPTVAYQVVGDVTTAVPPRGQQIASRVPTRCHSKTDLPASGYFVAIDVASEGKPLFSHVLPSLYRYECSSLIRTGCSQSRIRLRTSWSQCPSTMGADFTPLTTPHKECDRNFNAPTTTALT